MHEPVTTQIALGLLAALVLLAFAYGVAFALWRLAGRQTRRLPHIGTRFAEHRWARAFAARYPRLTRVVARRLSLVGFGGLPMTVLFLMAVALTYGFIDIAEDVVTDPDLHDADVALMRMLDPWRVPVLIEIFRFVSGFGDGSAATAVAIASAGLLWRHGRARLIPPLTLTVVGALMTTWIGKYAFARPRPTLWDIVNATSPAFPSGHATAAAAVYGFLAYAVARGLPHPRGRFEVAFWGAALIAATGFSRVFLGVHFPSDVASGFLIGGIWLVAGIAWVEWMQAATGTER